MSCEKITGHFPDYLIGEIDEPSKQSLQSHIETCTSCRKELEDLNEIWTKLGVIPEVQPNTIVKTRFYEMLNSYKEGLDSENDKPHQRPFWQKLPGWIWPEKPSLQLASALIFLIIGISTGLLIPPVFNSSQNFNSLQSEMENLRQVVAVSLIEKSSPGERLMGINYSTRLRNPDQRILNILLNTLNNDPNTNVRLSAVDALYIFNESPMVREGLLDALNRQYSPLVQVALMELLVDIREKRAVRSLTKLLNNNNLEPEVKKQAQLSIKELRL